MIVQLGIHREIETVAGIGPTMLAGIGLVGLSLAVMLHITTDANLIAREDLAFALSVLLLGLLIMVTRRNAVGQVVGFMSLENGLVLAATGAKGMPLVVEISVAFSVLIAFIVIGIFLFRIRERFDTVDMRGAGPVPGRPAMSGLSDGLSLTASPGCWLFRRWRRRCWPFCPATGSPPGVNMLASFPDLAGGAVAVRGMRRARAPISWSTISISSSSCSTRLSASPPACSAPAISAMSWRPAG